MTLTDYRHGVSGPVEERFRLSLDLLPRLGVTRTKVILRSPVYNRTSFRTYEGGRGVKTMVR